MGGFASAIGGVGQAAQGLGSQLRAQSFAHQENSLKQLQEQYNNLADALERTKANYAALAPNIAANLDDVEMQIRAAHMPGQPVDPQSYQNLLQKYLKAKQQAAQDWAVHPNNPINKTMATPAVQNAIAQATGAPAPIPPVGATQIPPPFQNAIGQGAPQTPPYLPNATPDPNIRPMGAPAAQPATSPVQPAAQGGGNSSPATFPTAPVQPVAAPQAASDNTDAAIPTLSTSTSGASVAPIVDLDSLLARPLAESQATGRLSPLIHEALTHQMGTQAALEQLYRSGGVNLQLGKNKLEAIQPIIQDLHDHPENMLQDLMQIEVLTGGSGGSAMALGPLLSALNPRAIPGQETVASAEARYPGFLAAHGYDVSKLDPNQPVRVQTSKLPPYAPISIEVSAFRQPDVATAQGFQAYNPYAQTFGGPIPGATPPVMAPTVSETDIPGQLPQKTFRQRTAPGAAPTGRSSGGGIPPVAAPRSSAAPAGGGGGGSSVIATNYNDWIAGKATLSDKEQTAARNYAQQHGLPTPDMLSPSGQKAIASLQPILDEIEHAQALIKAQKLDTMKEFDSKIALGKAYAKYSYGRVDDPLAKAISDLSFDSLRSVGQALQGTGSRAYPIFVRGLEHTPVIGLNSDSGKLMYDKLDGMKRRVQEAIEAARTETKSGIVPVQPVKASEGGMIRARDPQGNLHEAPAGTPLPKGWKLE